MKRTLILVAAIALVLTGMAATAQASDLPSHEGHYYELVADPGIAWPDAAMAAEAKSAGCPSHLATVTSAHESGFLYGTFGEDYNGLWLGGFQDAGVVPPDAGWQWVTGEPWSFTEWAVGEPNDAYGPASEQHLLGWVDGAWNDEYNLENVTGYLVEYEDCEVAIDVQPGRFRNVVNTNAPGRIPVAIFGSDVFDVAAIDATSLLFEGAPVAHDMADPGMYATHLFDADGDGYTDLVVHFAPKHTSLVPGDTTACLVGVTVHGPAVTGCDTLYMVK